MRFFLRQLKKTDIALDKTPAEEQTFKPSRHPQQQRSFSYCTVQRTPLQQHKRSALVYRDGALLHANSHHGTLVAVGMLGGRPVGRLRLLLYRTAVWHLGIVGRVRERRVAEPHQRGLVPTVCMPRRGRVALHRREARRLVGVVDQLPLPTQ